MRENGKKDILYERMKNDISLGNYTPGYRFPPEIDLARQLGISRNTLRSALKKLETENLLVRIKSKGTFVAPYHEGSFTRHRLLVLSQVNSNLYNPCHYIMPGMIREAIHQGYELENCDIDIFINYTEEQIRNFIRENRITGIIVISSGFRGDENIIKALTAQEIPIILTHGYFRDYQITNWPTIYCDIQAGWEAAVRYLVRLGHRKIITTNFIYSNRMVRQWPRSKYLELLESLEVDADESLIVDIEHFDHEALKAKLTRVFRSSSEMPTAVLCYSDFQAPTVYRVLEDFNLRIPQDVAVMGFCGAPDGKFMSPPLSTIDLNYQNIGRKTIEVMAASSQWFDPRQSEYKAPPLIKCPFRLEERASTRVKRFEYQLTNS